MNFLRAVLTRWSLVLALLGAACARGEVPGDRTVRVWSAEGLSDRRIVGLAQTPDGFLWTATPTRLARFDGAKFVEFTPQEIGGESDSAISVIAGSRDGSLWVAMNGGRVLRLSTRGGSPTIYTTWPGIPDGLVEDGEGAMWISFRGGTVCRIRKEVVTTFVRRAGLQEGMIALTADEAGRIWYIQNGSVGIFREERFEPLLQLRNVTSRIEKAKGGGVWIMSGHVLFKFKEGEAAQELAALEPFPSIVRPAVLHEDRAGVLWIGTSEVGLLAYNGNEFEPVPTSFRAISALLEDTEGNLWAGTLGGGLNHVRPQAIGVEGEATGLPFATVQSLCEDLRGELWAATHDGKFVVRTDSGWSLAPGEAGTMRGATCVAADAAGAIWVGTRNTRFYRWQNERLTAWGAREGLRSHTIHALLVDRRGDVWIAGNMPISVQRVSGDRFHDIEHPVDMAHVTAIAESASGQIWMGTNSGALLRFETDRLIEQELPQTAVSRGAIRALHFTDDGSLWIAFDGGGLGRLRHGRFANIRTDMGLLDDALSIVIDDRLGWLWFGADQGIFKVRRSELDAVVDGLMDRVQPVHYGAGDGLPRLLPVRGDANGALRSRDGRLWIPMGTALVVIKPKQADNLFGPAPVVLTQVKLDEQPRAFYHGPISVTGARGQDLSPRKPEQRSLRLPPDHRKVEFEFAGLSFAAPENVHFRYRLSGFDGAWVDAGVKRTAAYPRLPAGDYRFDVMACNSAGVWNEAPATLAFFVAPFFWQTWWFQAVVVALFTLAVIWSARVVSYRRLRQKVRVLEQEAALERERARIARDIHDDVGNRLTRIVLLTGLAQRDRRDPEKAAEHLQRISESAVAVTDSFDEIVWAVNPKNDTLPHLIEYVAKFALEFLRMANIRCEVELPERPPECSVPAEVRHDFFLVAKEALNNVVRHSGATEVRLKIVITAKEVIATIDDNGRGFAAPPETATADGLRNMRVRMEEIGGNFELASAPGKGTRVTFALPRTHGAKG